MAYLSDNAHKILEHIRLVQRNQIIYEAKLLEIYEGSIEKFLLESMQAEFSAPAFARAKERIAPINILPKLIKKISGVYNCGAHREVMSENEFDNENVAYFKDNLALDTAMDLANQYLNLFRHCAIEPYIYKGEPQLRVLPPTTFTVWTDDQVNKLIPKVFIKFVGKGTELIDKPRTDTMGVSNIQTEQILEEVDLFHLYTDEEFIILSSAGTVRYDLMVTNPEGVNYFGIIPFVYLNVSNNLLIPLPNSDMFKMSILIPKLLTDLNYATKFQSHAIMYTIDIESSALNANPDTMWELKSRDNGDGTKGAGSVGTIKPEVDVEKVLSLIKETLTIWFDSLGIKASGIQNITAQSASSGIAKAIDESDTQEVIRDQQPIMKKAEIELWEIIQNQFEHWSTANELNTLRPFSTEFDIGINFKEKEVSPDPKSMIETAKLKLDAGLTSFKRALRMANPELNDEELKLLEEEIFAEKAERAIRAVASFGNVETEEEVE